MTKINDNCIHEHDKKCLIKKHRCESCKYLQTKKTYTKKGKNK